VLQSTDALIPAFQSAAAAKEGPDIQYFWGGVWTVENAWSGAIIPLDDLIPAEEMGHYINNFERAYDGKQWGIGWYLSGNPMVFNPKLFEAAGLDPANPPKTWDELKAACGKLKDSGVVPIAAVEGRLVRRLALLHPGAPDPRQREGIHASRHRQRPVHRPRVRVETLERAQRSRLLERGYQLLVTSKAWICLLGRPP
jgi:hypothetical protein